MERVITAAIRHTSQTYVDALKQQEEFAADRQQEALRRAITKAKLMLTEDAKVFLEMAYGDLEGYLTMLIEAEIHRLGEG